MHPERRQKLETVKCDHLAADPLSVKLYGKPNPSKELLDGIVKHGLGWSSAAHHGAVGRRERIV
jgi:hypothetical protein